MDDINRKILDILQESGRAAYTDIAEELDVTEGTVRNRVERMVEDGTIERFTVEVGKDHEIEAFVMVEVATDMNLADIIEELPGNAEVYELAGDQDLLVHAARNSSKEINDTVDAIRAVDGVETTQTYMVLGKPR